MTRFHAAAIAHVTATSQTHSQSQAHSHCDVPHFKPNTLELGSAIKVVNIEFARNYASFNSNYYYFMRLTQL